MAVATEMPLTANEVPYCTTFHRWCKLHVHVHSSQHIIYPCVPRSAPGIGMRVEHLSFLWLTFSHPSSSEKSSQSGSPLHWSERLMQRPRNKVSKDAHLSELTSWHTNACSMPCMLVKRHREITFSICCLNGRRWSLPVSLQVKLSSQ